MKRSVKMISLLCVLLLLCGGYVLLQNTTPETAVVTETDGSFALSEKTAENITGLRWTDGDTAWSFIKTEGTWMNADSAAFPVNQSVLNSLAEELGSLTAIRKITDVTSPADYGMAAPAQAVTVTYDDNSAVTYTEGSVTPFDDGCYLQLSDQVDVVYTIACTLADTFSLGVSDLAVKETVVLPEEPTRMAIGTDFDVTKGAEGWTETDSGLIVDGDRVEDVLYDISVLTWSTLVSAEASASDLETLGLTDEAAVLVTVEGADGAMKLLLGAADSSENYYARLAGSKMVYTIAGSEVTALLGEKTADLWPAEIFTAMVADVQEVTFTTDSGSYTLTPELRAAETAPAETEAVIAAEGEETVEAAAEEPRMEAALVSEKDSSLWSRLTALKATDRADGEQAADRPLLTVRAVMNDGNTAEITFCEYDLDSYIVRRTGYPDRLVSAGDVDTLLRILRSA